MIILVYIVFALLAAVAVVGCFKPGERDGLAKYERRDK